MLRSRKSPVHTRSVRGGKGRTAKRQEPPLQKGASGPHPSQAKKANPNKHVPQARHTAGVPALIRNRLCAMTLSDEPGSQSRNLYKEFTQSSDPAQTPEIVFRDTMYFDSQFAAADTKPWQVVYLDDTQLTWGGTASGGSEVADRSGSTPLRGTLSMRNASLDAADENITPLVAAGIYGNYGEREGDIHGSCSRIVPRTNTPQWVKIGSWDYSKMMKEGFTFSTASNKTSAMEVCRFLILDSDSGNPVSGPLQFMFQYEMAVNLPPLSYVNLGLAKTTSINTNDAPTFVERPAIVKAVALRNMD